MLTRPVLADLANARFDLVVIGAGINGSGIARDAALRGLRTLLLDKGDIGGGTTSWSTRLIHGGLRYLEHGEIGLVRESLRERERLLRLAPHLVRPLPLVIPVYRGDKRGTLLVKAGMVAYDALSFDKSLRRHRMLGRAEALRRVPGLDPTGLRGAAVYYDAQVEFAERLAVENALAATAAGASVLTYGEVERLVVVEGRIKGVMVRDRLKIGREVVDVWAKAVVNVAGPWVDQILAGVDHEGERPRPLIGGTKGSHIVVGAFPGAPADGLYVEARRDGRPFFIIPWNDQYLIGTTDSRYLGDLDHVVVDDNEIEYLLAETNRVVPGAELTISDVHYSYAGVRPLPYQPDGVEGAISRRHQVIDHEVDGGPNGLFSVVGGKLTTYRELAAQVVDAVADRLGQSPIRTGTGEHPLPGGTVRGEQTIDEFRAQFVTASGLPVVSAEHLLRVYGTRAADVLGMSQATPALGAAFDAASGAIAAEVVFAFREEGAATLADALLRRTMVGLGPEAGVGADERAALIGREYLGWDDARAEAEVANYRAYLTRFRPRSLGGRPRQFEGAIGFELSPTAAVGRIGGN